MTVYPKNVVIIGGGVIGVEFATILGGFGSRVTIVEMLPRLLPEMDADIAKLLRRRLEKSGATIHTAAKLLRVGRKGSGIVCFIESEGKQLEFETDAVMTATGRRPAADGLGLAALGLATEKNGGIKTNDSMQTALPHVFAIGDVTGRSMLAHVATAQAKTAANVIAGKPSCFDWRIIPSCVYTKPEAAGVGLTEEAARTQGLNVKIGKSWGKANGKSLLMGETEGFVKLVADTATGEIVGAHLFAPRASDMIAELCLALKLECTVKELAETIHPHPTVSEMIKDAAERMINNNSQAR